MSFRTRLAAIAGAGALAAGGIVVAAAGPAAAAGCHLNGFFCGTLENHTSKAIWVCNSWKGDNADNHFYGGWKKHCAKKHRHKVSGHHTYGKPQKVDVDAVWVPGGKHFYGSGNGVERCYPNHWTAKGGLVNHGRYGRWYKFPTDCAIVVRSQ